MSNPHDPFGPNPGVHMSSGIYSRFKCFGTEKIRDEIIPHYERAIERERSPRRKERWQMNLDLAREVLAEREEE